VKAVQSKPDDYEGRNVTKVAVTRVFSRPY